MIHFVLPEIPEMRTSWLTHPTLERQEFPTRESVEVMWFCSLGGWEENDSIREGGREFGEEVSIKADDPAKCSVDP